MSSTCSPSWSGSSVMGAEAARPSASLISWRRQEARGDEAGQRRQRADGERRGQAVVVGHPAEGGHAEAAGADGEANDQAGGPAGGARQIGLGEDDRDGK